MTDEEILDHAQQETDEDLQLFLIEYVELHIEIGDVMTKIIPSAAPIKKVGFK